MSELYRSVCVIAMWITKVLMWIGPPVYAMNTFADTRNPITAIYVAIGCFVVFRFLRDWLRKESLPEQQANLV